MGKVFFQVPLGAFPAMHTLQIAEQISLLVTVEQQLVSIAPMFQL